MTHGKQRYIVLNLMNLTHKLADEIAILAECLAIDTISNTCSSCMEACLTHKQDSGIISVGVKQCLQ